MITKLFTNFAKDESGAAMVEYAVALLVVTAIGIGTMTVIGGNAAVLTDATCDGLNAGVAASSQSGSEITCP